MSTSSSAIWSRKRALVPQPFGLGDALQAFELALGAVHVRDVGAFVREQVLGVGPALVLLADQLIGRHFDVVEPDLVHLVRAVEHDDRAHRHAGRLHVDQQERDAGLRLALVAGAHQAEDPFAVLAQRGPGLLAVDDVVVAAALGLALERGQVGARAGLAVALAPPDLAAGNAGQEAPLLLGRAEGHDHRRHHHRAERHPRAARRPARIPLRTGGVAPRSSPGRRIPSASPSPASPAGRGSGPSAGGRRASGAARGAPCG